MNKKTKLFVVCSTALASFALLLTNIFVDGKTKLNPAKGETETYVCTINKDSVVDTSAQTVKGTTKLGNDVTFSYEAFDVRPNPGDWNEAICFYGTSGGASSLGHGGNIRNNTALYSVKSVRVYGYSNDSHTGNGLSGFAFNLYYGYEKINVVGAENLSKVNFTGSYTFPEGYEPSYIALEQVGFTGDLLCEKVEIEYSCEPVVGTSVTKTAYQYDYTGKEFTYANGNKVAYEVTEAAPWARTQLSAFDLVPSTAGSLNAGHTATRTLTDEAVTLTGYYNAGLAANIGSESEGRNILSIKMKPSATSWGANIYLFAYSGSTQLFPSTQLSNIHIGTWIAAGLKVYNESGVEVTSINSNDFFTFEIDLSSKLGAGEKVTRLVLTSGYDAADSGFANVTSISVKDLTFKATYCGHTADKIDTVSTGSQYGTGCTVCGAMKEAFVSSTAVAIPSGKTSDDFSVEEGVTYDERPNCVKLTTSIYTNDADGGWAVNYKYTYVNLIKNARATGKTIIKLHVYNQCSSSIDTRLGWGVGNNASAAWADHWNNPSCMIGTDDVKDNTTITDETGATAKLQANAWRIIVIDVSDDAFANWDDLWLTSSYNTSKVVPITTYVSNIECVAPAA